MVAMVEATVDIHSNNYGHYSVLAWCNLHQLPCDNKLASIHGRKLSKICRAAGRTMFQVRDARWGYVKTYPQDVLQRYFDDTEDK